MNRSFLNTAFAALALAVASGTFLAAQDEDAPRPTKPKSAKPPVKHKPKPPVGPQVDINGASKAELMKLPGVTADVADRIIKGRPYLTKGHLVLKGVIHMGIYEPIKKKIIAKQDLQHPPKPVK
jgi:DNA uptake protein ComE-like DNA-binding protein